MENSINLKSLNLLYSQDIIIIIIMIIIIIVVIINIIINILLNLLNLIIFKLI